MIFIHPKIQIQQIVVTQAPKLKRTFLQVKFHNSTSSTKSFLGSCSETDSFISSENTKYVETNKDKDDIDVSSSCKRNKLEDDAKFTAFSTPFGTKVTSYHFKIFILLHLVRIRFSSKNYGFI